MRLVPVPRETRSGGGQLEAGSPGRAHSLRHAATGPAPCREPTRIHRELEHGLGHPSSTRCRLRPAAAAQARLGLGPALTLAGGPDQRRDRRDPQVPSNGPGRARDCGIRAGPCGNGRADDFLCAAAVSSCDSDRVPLPMGDTMRGGTAGRLAGSACDPRERIRYDGFAWEARTRPSGCGFGLRAAMPLAALCFEWPENGGYRRKRDVDEPAVD